MVVNIDTIVMANTGGNTKIAGLDHLTSMERFSGVDRFQYGWMAFNRDSEK